MEFEEALELIKADGSLRAVIKTARSYGVSLRRFMGWEPKITTKEYPGRVVQQAEAEWDDEGRMFALAYAHWEASLCSGCGQPFEECTDAENEGRYRVGSPTRCHACTARQMSAELYTEAPQSEALLFDVNLMPSVPEVPDVSNVPDVPS